MSIYKFFIFLKNLIFEITLKKVLNNKLRVFDLDGVTNRSEEMLPGRPISPNFLHDPKITTKGLRFDPNHFR